MSVGTLGEAIDKAVKEQYPNGQKPTVFQQAVKKSEKDRWSERFALQLRDCGLVLQKEHRFHPERMWRFDFALPGQKLGIEIDGGGFGRVVVCGRCKQPVMRFRKDGTPYAVREGGRHNTGAGQEADHEKMNAAVALGWRVFRFTPKHIKDGYAIKLIKTVVGRL